MNPTRFRSERARIDWGYFAAAAIQGASIKRHADQTWSARGTVITFDAFKIRQRPLVFIARVKNRKGEEAEWRWPVTSIDLGPGTGPREMRATLGPQLPEMVAAHGTRR
jgi:hypothetical protein